MEPRTEMLDGKEGDHLAGGLVGTTDVLEGEVGSGQFVCLLIGIQPELKTFVAHLMPFADARGDILQDVNLAVWEKRGQFQPGTNFRAWVYTFARNVTMNHQKRAGRKAELTFGEETLELLAAEFSEADPTMDSRLPALRKCLGKVNVEDRTVLLARYARHGAVEEAALESGRTAAALRGLLFRLRVALRHCVEREMKSMPGNAS
ncbi:MAG: sigma factor [Luteolibacter sp.]|uniref:sigma factor n=1 Tax=Luteolibacter sp. TaxID=1962973 RepID=UPI0032653E8D